MKIATASTSVAEPLNRAAKRARKQEQPGDEGELTLNYSQDAQRMLDDAGPTMDVTSAAYVVWGYTGKTTGYAMAQRGQFEEAGIKIIRTGRRLRVVTADVRRVLGLA